MKLETKFRQAKFAIPWFYFWLTTASLKTLALPRGPEWSRDSQSINSDGQTVLKRESAGCRLLCPSSKRPRQRAEPSRHEGLYSTASAMCSVYGRTKSILHFLRGKVWARQICYPYSIELKANCSLDFAD